MKLKRGLYYYIREECLPTPFCPGCGHGILMNSIIHALDELEIDMAKTVFVSGIGCAAWIPSPHFRADTLHTLHGRPLAFATGVKTAQPDMNVIVVSGDGDLASIGGNHLINAARRNIKITAICANNHIYAMTGGQTAATTPFGIKTVTAPEGSQFRSFDLCHLAIGAGAKYVARGTVSQPAYLSKMIANAIKSDGFAFVDALSPCVTHFARAVGKKNPNEMIEYLKTVTRRGDGAELLSHDINDGVAVIGEYERK